MFLGIDCGTQGTKVLVLNAESGKVLGEGSAPHSLISDHNGRREQDVQQWLDALQQATRDALAQAGVSGQQIQGIGVSGQQHGLVLLDALGEVLRPAKLWCDTESAPENQRLLDYLGGAQGSLQRLGLVIAPGYTVSKLLWTKEQHPQVFERIDKVLLPHDYLNYWLTGRCCTEFGDASGTGYFNVRSREWDLPLLAHIDPSGRLGNALPQLLEADAPIGKLLPDIARLLGLNPDALVSSGGGDNMMGAIGTGNIQPGLITMSLGSSGTVYAYGDEVRVSEHESVATFCSSSGGWLPLICTMNLTNATTAIRELFALNIKDFNEAIAQAPIGAEGVLILPFFNGERVPAMPDATASIVGLDSTNLTQANLCRAVVEGTTFGLRYGLDLLSDSGIKSEKIRLIGGGSKSAVWRQIVADIMNTPVICTLQPEAAALGAAIQAAWCRTKADGTPETLQQLCERCVSLDPDSETHPVAQSVSAYQQVYQRYQAQLREV
ncbi:xylulokinase [Pseudomonas syringae]|uniref:Xylulose kinase n=1 Tax=Pseudomonas syringae pv. actinidiae TaxID=103796 RepID=A0A2V0QAW9_PSESF|nr:xylulokinase [Pseudomonas syringae]AQL37349.1 xylulokinase [Pseudomonas syringae pv. actinidiae ICMP 9853]EGH67932.1 xylulokinase [Pseudomonas syringae pv. actinidiae str. M302091]EPM55064.1 xylulokinase [Pseudomonas syringae pv. actinidiae ICMP 19071]EPM62683.1 xylulokinase [Pseudomonas syringae pv. actinidiae ICMP 19103]EPM63428.1 xylulokinase [Pseudomonas syringae pv. actinidiae ICMP 19073]